jgi:hypothetical protein
MKLQLFPRFTPALALLLSALWTCGQEPGKPPGPAASGHNGAAAKDGKLRQELLARMAEDQRARQEILKYLREHQEIDPDSLKNSAHPPAAALREIDRRNTARMKEIVDRYGWPGFALVGKDGEQAAWLLVQHADRDHAFQKRCLVLVTEAVRGGQAAAEHLAYLTDRVRVAEKRKQVYGTQFHYVGSRLEPEPIEDESHVDSRRQAMGLPSMAQYRAMMEKM